MSDEEKVIMVPTIKPGLVVMTWEEIQEKFCAWTMIADLYQPMGCSEVIGCDKCMFAKDNMEEFQPWYAAFVKE